MYRVARILTMAGVIVSIYCLVLLVVLGWPLSSLIVGFCAFAYIVRRSRGRVTNLGSARWADETDLSRAGMLDADRGLIIGRVCSTNPFRLPFATKQLFRVRDVSPRDACRNFWSRRRGGHVVRLPKAIHIAIFSPSGGGKGVSCVIPHCLTCEDGMVVLDPKGEIALKTADFRKKQFGQKIALLDPYKVVSETPDTYCPLDFIDEQNSLAIEHCRNLANAIVVRSPDEREPHFPESAAMWISAMIAVVVVYGNRGENRSLKTVYEFLCDPAKRDLAVKLMCESTCWDGALAAMGWQLLNFIEKEKSSVMTTIARHMSFVGTPAVMASVQTSSFDPRLLRTGQLSAYLILPPSHQRAGAGLMRLWISSLLENVVSGGLQE